MKTESIANLISAVISLFAIILNIIGINILVKSKRPYSNQIKIMLNISLLDILISAFSIGKIILELISMQQGDLYSSFWIMSAVLFFIWYMTFYLMMFDRFLSCRFPFWYRTYAAVRYIKIILIVYWASLLLLIPILYQIDFEKTKHEINTFAWLTFDAIFICGFIVLYSMIYCLKRQSNMRSRRNVAHSDNKRFFRVISAMLVTFLILEASPTVLLSILNMLGEYKALSSLFPFFNITWRLNLLADPLIYIFMQPDMRKKASLSMPLL